jgi:hypothetical protein
MWKKSTNQKFSARHGRLAGHLQHSAGAIPLCPRGVSSTPWRVSATRSSRPCAQARALVGGVTDDPVPGQVRVQGAGNAAGIALELAIQMIEAGCLDRGGGEAFEHVDAWRSGSGSGRQQASRDMGTGGHRIIAWVLEKIAGTGLEAAA